MCTHDSRNQKKFCNGHDLTVIGPTVENPFKNRCKLFQVFEKNHSKSLQFAQSPYKSEIV